MPPGFSNPGENLIPFADNFLKNEIAKLAREVYNTHYMENFTLVRPEHLNHYGFLFGGQMLKWVDEYAWLAAARDFPGQILLTRAMDKSEFKISVKSGSILRFEIARKKRGKSSVCYSVIVHTHDGSGVEVQVFSTDVTFVCITEEGHKKVIP